MSDQKEPTVAETRMIRYVGAYERCIIERQKVERGDELEVPERVAIALVKGGNAEPLGWELPPPPADDEDAPPAEPPPADDPPPTPPAAGDESKE